MTRSLIKISSSALFLLATGVVTFMTTSTTALAQITNPAIGNMGSDDCAAQSGTLFVNMFISWWNSAIAIGAVITLVLFIWGAIEWITSSGDSGKVQKSQQKMLQGAIGLFILVSSYILIGFVSGLLFGSEFDILRPQFFVPGMGDNASQNCT